MQIHEIRITVEAKDNCIHPLNMFVISSILISLVCLQHAATESHLPDNIRQDIMKNDDDVAKIKEYFSTGAGKGMAYNRLATFVDKTGSRFTGSQSLEEAIDWMKTELEKEQFDKVYTEDVNIPIWIRGSESAEMLEPRSAKIAVLGLQNSVSGNVTAEIIVVRSFDELYQKRADAKDKIVVFNQGWVNYGHGYEYRNYGATHAANLGAVGAFIRSVADYSIYTPHTGSQTFWDNVTAIPSACITEEDSEMFQRLYDKNIKVVVHFEASHEKKPEGISRNLIAEITGSEFPDEVVLFGGHIDSWDVGVGAMDDGGGIMITRQILTTVKALGLKPRRTMRLVMYTGEEVGIYGGDQYFEKHKADIDKISFVMESDYGTFTAKGLGLGNATDLTKTILEEILKLYLADMTVSDGASGTADVRKWIEHGVPGAGLVNAYEKYFYYHHTEGDRMIVYKPEYLDTCASLFTVVAYVVAMMDTVLPRGVVSSASLTISCSWTIMYFIALLVILIKRY